MNTILTITCEVRGGGYGNRAWIAKITGSHPKYGLARDFVQSERNLSRSGKSGYIFFHITDPGIYEVRGIQLDKSQARVGKLWDGFIRVESDGTFDHIEKPVF